MGKMRRYRGLGLLVIAGFVSVFAPLRADEDETPPCHQVPAQKNYARTEAAYVLPDVTLMDQDGRPVTLRDALDGPGPVAVDFVFTTCTTICPVMTATFSKMRRELESTSAAPRLVSISIDPEYDRPERLKEYTEKFKTGSDWTFLTGSREDVKTALTALDAWAENKMTHKALYLLRIPGHEEWVRIEGLASAQDLVTEYRTLLDEDDGLHVAHED